MNTNNLNLPHNCEDAYFCEQNTPSPLTHSLESGARNFYQASPISRHLRFCWKPSQQQTDILLLTRIRKQYDLAWKLDNMYDNYAIPTFEVLMAITSNFPTEISFWEALIYPSKKNMHEKLANRSSLLYYSFRYLYTRAEDTLWKMRRFKDNYYSCVTRNCYDITCPNRYTISDISVDSSPHSFGAYFPLLYAVFHYVEELIKRIEKKRKEFEAAKILLYNLIKNMDFSRTYYYEYKYKILEALRQDVYEVVRPILQVNADNETPEMVFTREHANLVKEGEQWMKTTTESCSITAALIVTIVFAAAITVPGGNNLDTSLPLFKNEVAFNIFAVCDATSLFTAATALLVFLSILTACSEKIF
ncbi:ankyrin repeat-containing protein [Tanacetum coccineum]